MSSPNDDPWQGLLSDLGVAPASPPPLPAASSTPAPPKRVPSPPKPVAAPPSADWNALATNLGVSVTNTGMCQPTPKAEPIKPVTVSVGGVEIVRAVRGPNDTDPPLMGGLRSSGDAPAPAGEADSREQRPRSDRGSRDSDRGGRGEQRGGRDDRSRGGRGRGGNDRGGSDRGPGDRGGRSDQPRGEQSRGSGRSDHSPEAGRPAQQPVEGRVEHDAEPRAIEPRSSEPRSAEPRSGEPRGDDSRRSGSRRGGRDQGRSRGPRDLQQRDPRRPAGERDQLRPPVSETPPRAPESRRYRDDEDDDLDDLRAPIRSTERPGEPTLDSNQASRKLWDDEDTLVSPGNFNVFGIIDEKIGGPPVIERSTDDLDDVHGADVRDEVSELDAPVEGELEPGTDRPRRRRRRRGGRSGRRSDGTSRSTPRVPREGDELLEPAVGDEPLAGEGVGPDAEGDAERPGRRRRRRRTGRAREDRPPRAASPEGVPLPPIDESEDLEPIRSREAHQHEDDDLDDQHHKHLHRDVTPWKEAIGFLVTANLENRSRSPRGPERGRGYRGGRDRG